MKRNKMKLGALLAVMLIVSMAFVPAVSAKGGDEISKDKNSDWDVEEKGSVGLGSYMDATLSGSGVINSTTIWIPTPVFKTLRYYNVEHDGSGSFNVDLYRIPIGSYELGVVFPDGMTVSPDSATGAEYVGEWVSNFNSYRFQKDGWFVGTIHLKVPVEFDAGNGVHGIITAGGSNMGVLGGFFAGMSSCFEYILAGAIGASSIAALITAAVLSGANIDILYFNEG